jgi:hypothetical protein
MQEGESALDESCVFLTMPPLPELDTGEPVKQESSAIVPPPRYGENGLPSEFGGLRPPDSDWGPTPVDFFPEGPKLPPPPLSHCFEVVGSGLIRPQSGVLPVL